MADVAAIARNLNKVKSVAQARAAAGAALKAVHYGYDVAGELPDGNDSVEKGSATRILDEIRGAIESQYRELPDVATWAVPAAEWTKLRKSIERAYIEIAGIEGAAHHKPETSLLSILGTSIAEAPGVFFKAAGKVAGEALNTAGKAAGSAVGGLFSGIGLPGLVLVAVVVFVFVFARKRGLA